MVRTSELNLADGADVDSPITNHGTLTIDADLQGQATVDALTLTDASTIEIGLQGVIPGQYNALSVDGNAILDGALVVSLDPAFSALPGNEFTILSTNFGIVSGEFDAVVLPSIEGLTFDILYPDNHTVVLQVVETLPGDYNDDGVVDALDYTVWRNNLGDANETDIHNNGDGGDVSASDFTFWKQHYGDLGPGGGGLATGMSIPAPEPATGVILGPLVAFFHCRRKRKQECGS